MKVKTLKTIHYNETGREWHSEAVENPTWEQIEVSIRALDKFRRPSIDLMLGDDPPETGYLSVFGGDGTYALSAAVGGEFPSYYDPAKSDKTVDVWTSDQGYYPEEKYVCYDLTLVLKIAFHYAQFGELSALVEWR